MALIECPECRREVSSSASVCPACAYPIGTGTPDVPVRAVRPPSKPQWWKIAISVVGRIGLGAMIAGIGGGEEESVAAVIGGVIIGGSAIPTWYRWKIAGLRSSSADTALGDRLEYQMSELEKRHREQMVQLRDVHAGQMAELEERVDFAERLLTQHREPIGPG